MTLNARVVAASTAVALLACPVLAADRPQGHAPKPDAHAAAPAQVTKPDAPAAKPQAPPPSGDAKAQAHAPSAKAQDPAPAANPAPKAPAASAAKTPPAGSKPAADSPSVDDVVKRINAILAEGPGPGAAKKTGAADDRQAVAPAKPRGATRTPQSVVRGAQRPLPPPGPSRRGIVLTWDPALTRRGVTLEWDPELTRPAEPAGVRLRWPER